MEKRPQRSDIPQVSIVTPIFNRESLLGRAIRSVLSQTFQEWELILVDDGSVDRTKEIIEYYATRDNRIKPIFLDKNSGGPAHPRNVGLQNACSNKFIAFLDSDDEWLPGKLEDQLRVFKRGPQKLGMVGCCVNFHKNEKFSHVYRISKRGDILKALLSGNFILSCSNLLIKKEAITHFLFDENLGYLDDWEMWMEIAAAGYTFDFVENPLFNYFLNESSMTSKLSRKKIVLEAEYIFNKHINLYRKLSMLGVGYRHLGVDFLKERDAPRSKHYVRQALSVNKFDFKALMLVCFISLGGLGQKIFRLLLSF